MRNAILVSTLVLVSIAAWSAETPAAKAEKTVTISASNQPVGDVLGQVAKSAGVPILVEKLVTGNVTADIKNVTAEEALDAIAKSNKLQWRAIYVAEGSSLARDPDSLAAQMRTVLSVRFPDIVVTKAGAGGSFVHVQRETSANDMIKAMPPAAGFRMVYLVTDDEKAYTKELKDEAKKKVSKYVEGQKQLLESFLDMSPEERTQAMKESINLAGQMNPKIMADMMTSMLEMDPEFMVRQGKIQMDALMSMDTEARRNLLRLSIRSNIDAMKNMPPELMQQFQEVAAEIAKSEQPPSQPSNEQ